MRRLGLLALALAAAACDLGRDAAFDGHPGDAMRRPPRTDLVPAVGTDASLDIACWNVENFPASDYTPTALADLIVSLQLDVVVVEEIASVDAWAELVARLRDYDAALSSHVYPTGGYQKLGVLWRRDVVTAGAFDERYQDDADAFPRPAIALPITYDDGLHAPLTLELLGVHLKAGTQPDDVARRTAAVARIAGDLAARAAAGEPNRVVILGDYNTVLGGADGDAVMVPLADPAAYTIRTAPLAAAGVVTFVPSSVMLDHVTTTAALDVDLADATTLVPPLDVQYPGYEAGVSDHLPVVLSIPR